ncbi:MAG: hypothetical protein K6C34_02560 [Alphaproteobacteria bacterium]|nr:hypothetical protein [Alphaproteobacteria bacterium]
MRKIMYLFLELILNAESIDMTYCTAQSPIRTIPQELGSEESKVVTVEGILMGVLHDLPDGMRTFPVDNPEMQQHLFHALKHLTVLIDFPELLTFKCYFLHFFNEQFLDEKEMTRLHQLFSIKEYGEPEMTIQDLLACEETLINLCARLHDVIVKQARQIAEKTANPVGREKNRK